MSSLQDVLNRYRDIYPGASDGAHSKKFKGSWFETLCWYYFKYDPLRRQRFSDVWLWSDWPGREGRPDTGIDIVAKLRAEEGEGKEKFCAIQCKFYEPGHCVSKADIDTFISASDTEDFAWRIVVSAADDWNRNAEETILRLKTPCVRLTVQDMERSPIDWSAFDLGRLDRVSYLPEKTLRDDQAQALAAVLDGFKSHDRGKLIMACGTGKTFTSLKIAERVAGPGKAVLFLVPSIALLNQTLLAWNADHGRDVSLISFAVCDEAHRTTGVTLAGEEESNFVRIHDADYIKAAKRLATTDRESIASDPAPMRSAVAFAGTIQYENRSLARAEARL